MIGRAMRLNLSLFNHVIQMFDLDHKWRYRGHRVKLIASVHFVTGNIFDRFPLLFLSHERWLLSANSLRKYECE